MIVCLTDPITGISFSNVGQCFCKPQIGLNFLKNVSLGFSFHVSALWTVVWLGLGAKYHVVRGRERL